MLGDEFEDSSRSDVGDRRYLLGREEAGRFGRKVGTDRGPLRLDTLGHLVYRIGSYRRIYAGAETDRGTVDRGDKSSSRHNT